MNDLQWMIARKDILVVKHGLNSWPPLPTLFKPHYHPDSRQPVAVPEYCTVAVMAYDRTSGSKYHNCASIKQALAGLANSTTPSSHPAIHRTGYPCDDDMASDGSGPVPSPYDHLPSILR
ncbi:hypothetical protein E6O75_ATG00640 [Venturia nashicola]|uniref:Uncharacterized protein n=1 Tax=Venturia nashicola TaxID=86259 RepID=A0A4Z1PG03_9PEZI|nr:hypothetical protein E6O75_ATG00640 [Venturia nashicola]